MTVDPEDRWRWPWSRPSAAATRRGCGGSREAAEELTEAYGDLPQFRGISVDDMDAHQEASEYPRPR